MRRPALVLLALLSVLALVPAAPRSAHAAGPYTYWFPWYDNASPGMQADNVHIVNPGPSGASITVSLPGFSPIQASILPGREWFSVNPFPNAINGPLQVTSDQPVIVSQRVTYGLSFNEFPALTEQGQSFWFPWYDRSDGAVHGDNIHVINRGTVTATVSVSIGRNPFSFTLSIPAGSWTYHAFPSGFIGGPVHVVSDQPIMVSQRVQYNQSFNEIAGIPEAARKTFQVINWYDNASPGYWADDIHVMNPDPATTVTATLHFPGHTDQTLTIAPQADAFANYPGQIGGPVTITATGLGVISTQRVNYWGSFKEYRSLTDADRSTDLWFNWYDNASPCMAENNIHLFTRGHSVGTITLVDPPRSIPFDVTGTTVDGGEWFNHFSPPQIGGPVHIHVASGYDPVYAESRTVRCPPPPPPPPAPPVPLPVTLHMPFWPWTASIESVGADQSGAMGVPAYSSDVAWFNMMPRPGDSGDSVITGHVNWTDSSCAVFCYLQYVHVGDVFSVDRADGSTVRFAVDGYNYYPADSPPDWLYTATGAPQLTLITCGGDFIAGHYKQRFLVHTHLI